METLIILGKYIAATAFLMIFYWIVLRHKASYRFNRIYLIAIPLLGMVMSGMHFDLHVSAPVAEAVFQQAELPAVLRPQEMPTPVAMVPQQPMPIRTELTKVEDLPVVADAPAQPIDYETHLRALLLSISLLLLGMIIYHTARLWRIKRQMQSIKTPEGYDLYRSEQIATPFSFARSIFLPANLEEHQEAMIIEHEKAHIGHRHYQEVWMMEFLVRLCWFNPVVWLCRSELRNIHEYEADHEVLKHGTDLFDYQTTLLQMVMNESSPVVSGFNHSFIRQRFIEMKNSTAGTLSRMGKLGMVAWISVLLLGFGIAACNIKVEQSPNNEIKDVNMADFTDIIASLPRLDKPQPFVLDIELGEECRDTVLYIYLSDDFFHIEKDIPTDTLRLSSHKCRYEISLDHVLAGRWKCGEVTGEEFFVPGETLSIKGGKENCSTYSSSFFDKLADYTLKYRLATQWKSPHIRPIDAPKWSNPQFHTESPIGAATSDAMVKEVYFTDSATILNIAHIGGDYSFLYYSNSYLRDESGEKHPIRRVLSNYDQWRENCIFGTYASFEPLPEGTKTFSLISLFRDITDIRPTLQDRLHNESFQNIISDQPVQLWEDGPLFAPMNVGAHQPGQYGLYLNWDAALNAASIAGEGWDVPTKQEWENLIHKCRWEYLDANEEHRAGILVHGTGNYAINSIFLPCAGDEDGYIGKAGTIACYWSNTPTDMEHAYYFTSYSGGTIAATQPISHGFSVRLVKRE